MTQILQWRALKHKKIVQDRNEWQSIVFIVVVVYLLRDETWASSLKIIFY